ncbi:hypothetical protein JW859_11505 [bacterium]|nr:hypothetical protein [bacterium]
MRRIWPILIGALCLLAVPARAADSTISLISFYAYDVEAGKQAGRTNFTWPDQAIIGALVRFETTGYDKRKTAEVFYSLTDRRGETLEKHTAELSVHAGEHEYVLPLRIELGRLFGADRYKLHVEAKLAGANRVSDEVELVLTGPPLPEVTVADLRLVDPDSGDVLDKLLPRQSFRILGTVAVRGNTTKRLPVLTVWGLMSKDELTVADWTEPPFCDTYWDRYQLDRPNGKWRFAIDGRMPEDFVQNAVESQPFEFTFTTAFTPGAYLVETLSGTVLASGTGTQVSSDLDDRLIELERNWYWEVERMD